MTSVVDQNFRVPPAIAASDGDTSPDPGVAGAVAYSTALGRHVVWTGSAWSAISGTIKGTLGADRSTTSNTLQDVTGLSLALKANHTYGFQIGFDWQSDSTLAGVELAIKAITGATIVYEGRIWTATGAVASGAAFSAGGLISALVTGAANSDRFAIVDGLVIMGGSDGELQPQFRSSNGVAQMTIKAGSCICAQAYS